MHDARRFSRRWLSAVLSLSLATSAAAQVDNGDANAQRTAARRAEIAAARGQVTRAQEQLRAATQRMQATWRANPDVAKAEADLAAAQADLDAAAKPLLERLRQSNPDYQAALQDEESAARRLAAEHQKAVAADPASTQTAATQPGGDARPENATAVEPQEQTLNVPVPSDAQVTAAVDKMDVRSRRRELEQQAIANDPSTQAARQRVGATTAQLKALRAEFDASLLNDADYRGARDALAAARADLARVAGAN